MTDDGFSAEIRARCVAHWPDLIRGAAKRWGMKDGEYIRKALADRLESDGFSVAPADTKRAVFDPGVFSGKIS